VAATTHQHDGELSASSIHVAALRLFSAMEHVIALEPARGEDQTDPSELARVQDAQELVTASLTDTGNDWLISLRRIEAGSGGILWAEEFNVAYEEPLSLADAVSRSLRRAYPNRKVNETATTFKVTPADYESYLNVQSEYNLAMVSRETGSRLIASLETIRGTSPNFLDSYLLESVIYRTLYENSRDTSLLEKALDIAEEAQGVAGTDSRAATLLFDLALRAHDVDAALAALQSLRRTAPGSVEVTVCEAMLAENQGSVKRAIDLMRKAADRSPSRGNVFRLADMEYRHGEHNAARERLQSLLVRFPNFDTGRTKLAEIELLYGDPARSEALYSEIVSRRPTVGWLINLGLARELLGKHSEAVADFRRALRMAPDNPYVMLNLADCLILVGNESSADSLYERVLKQYDVSTDLTWDDRMVAAQCLAHLGRQREAVRAAQEALQESQNHSEALYLASIVYAVVGDRLNALVTAERAMSQGVERRWFGLPWFDDLRGEPEFANVPPLPMGSAEDH
jgi:tetratricopeptide (TPR) repeat protein